ncbi:tetratricopeptide repeat protein, partial [Desulfolithobacter sp.]
QELEQNGAIKITTRGKNAPMDKILQSAHNKLLKVMFDPAPVDELTRMQAEKDPYSNLNQAVKMLKMGVGVLKSSSLYPYTVDPSAYVLAGAPFSWKRMLSSFSVTSAYAAEDKDAERRKRLKELQDEMKNYWYEKNYELVITKGREVLALYDMLGEDPPIFVYASLGVSNYHLQRYRDALQYFLKLDGMPDEREKRAVLASHIGHCYKKLGDCTSALPYFQKAVKLSDNSKFVARVYLRMGECAEEQQDYINAVTYYTSSSLLYRGENKLEDSKLAEEKAAQVVQNIYFEARKADDEARIAGYPSDLCGKALSLYDLYLTQARILGKVSKQRVREIESRKIFLARKMGGDESADSEKGQGLPTLPIMKDGTGKPGGSGSGDVQTAGTGKKKSGEKSAAAAGKEGKGKKEKKVVKKRGEKSSVKGKPAQGKKLLAKNSGKKKRPKKKKKRVIKSRKPGKPGFSLVASYRLRKIKRSGKMVYHMNHYRTETQAFAMAENIGNLYAMWGHDPKVFRAVNIDDPVFKQREILVSLDGQDFGTFSRHINFVTVQMRKRHQSGKLTTDEVVITPESFSKKGNLFTMIYGWKGDDDRQEWLNYHYKVLWSFHGGVEIRSPWLTTSSSMLALQPPFRYRTISIEGQGATLSRAGVRHAVVSITSRVNGKELTTTVTVRNRGTAPSMIVDFPEELEGQTATARITWFLKGGKRVESQAVPVKGNILYWDELPGQEV